MRVFTIVTLAFALLFVLVAYSKQAVIAQTYQHQLQVQQVCDRSRMMQDGSGERDCGTIQDSYGIEYLCTSNEPSAHCWTEVM